MGHGTSTGALSQAAGLRWRNLRQWAEACCSPSQQWLSQLLVAFLHTKEPAGHTMSGLGGQLKMMQSSHQTLKMKPSRHRTLRMKPRMMIISGLLTVSCGQLGWS